MVGEAYFVGYQYLVVPLVILCCLPLLTRVVLPLYYQLGISSIYEYLERRYDVRVRVAGSAMCVLWRVLWLASMLCATGQVLGVATGLRSTSGGYSSSWGRPARCPLCSVACGP